MFTASLIFHLCSTLLFFDSVVVMVTGSAEEDLPWWKTAVLYQVYPRSFKDSSGDGVGDLKGIANKAGYLNDIGVTAIWISPIFQSPMADFGYDISDYRKIDPTFGTEQEFKELVEKLRTLNIKLLLDLVPNHTSDEHEWFQKSVKKIDPYTDYYVWNDGRIDPKTRKRVPPNNWVNNFTGSAWELNEQRQQFYLHQFVKKQPDLNYRNPAVIKEMDEVYKFWLDIGVDGFRVDAVPFLVEDEKLRDEPSLPGSSVNLDHIYTQNQPETYQVTNHWADLVYNYTLKDGKQRALFIEAYADLQTTIKYYGRGKHSLMQPFNFQLLKNSNKDTSAAELKEHILSWVDNMPEGVVANWVIGNHDQGRTANRHGPDSVDAINILTGVLPGVKVVYNGEEIGMRDTFIRWDQSKDPGGLQLGPDHYEEGTRDPERTPMQWRNSSSAGFSSNNQTWLPVNPNYKKLNVESQKKAGISHLKVFQAVNRARKDPVLQRGDLKVLVPDENTLLVVRSLKQSYYIFIFNMGSTTKKYTSRTLFAPQDLDMDMTVVAASIKTGIETGKKLKEGAAKVVLRSRGAVLFKSN